MISDDSFEDSRPDLVDPDRVDDDRFVLDLDGYGGPIDVLLNLARDQKVDLAKISILDLADQYLSFIARARRLRLELAADYLVMAAWLAYLKSKLLLPEPEEDGTEPTGAEMAAALAFQLQRLESMQEAGARLMARPRRGQEFFARGMPEVFSVVSKPVYTLSLFELLQAYGSHAGRSRVDTLRILPNDLYSMDDALNRLRDMLGQVPDWRTLSSFLPPDMKHGMRRRSAMAATFAASLELVRDGRARLRQDSTFGPIYLRPATSEER